MSNPSHRQIVDREALTQAIETKVHKLDMDALVKLATELRVTVPGQIKAARTRRNLRPTQAPAPDQIMLKGGGIGPIVSAAEGARALDAITEDDTSSDWAESVLLGAGPLVGRLKISRTTLDNWRKAQKIIAIRKGLRNFVYPVRQFERLKPVDGLDAVSALFSSPEEAWEWLVAPNRMTDDRAPIELLRDHDIDRVVDAAKGALDYA